MPRPGELRNILLVEDNPADAKILARILTSATGFHFELLREERLDAALKHLRSGNVDVVLLDLCLPDSGGIDTIMRTRDSAPAVPIIVLTGMGDDSLGLEAVRLGAQDYLVKGFINKELLTRSIDYAIQRKKNEVELRDQAELLQSILRSTGDGVIVADKEGNYILFNDAAVAILGFGPSSEPVDKRADKYGLYLPDMKTPYPPENLPLLRAINGAEVTDEQIFLRNLRRPNGVWISVNASPLKDSGGQIIGGVLTIRDITERKILAEMWRKYEFIVNTSKDFLALISRELVYVAANDAYCRAHGKDRNEIVGKSVLDVWGKERFEKFIKSYLEACLTGKEVHDEAWFDFPELGERCFDITFYPYFGEESKVTHCVVVTHDITERMVAAAEMHKMNLVLSNAVEGISQVDVHGKYSSVNDAFVRLLGYEEGDILSEPWESIFFPGDESTSRNAFEHMQTAGSAEIDLRAVRPDNSLLNVHILLTRDVDESGKYAGFYCFMKDITEQVKAQELRIIATSLERSNKELDEFASVVSHDLQEPLRKIRSFGDLLKSKCSNTLPDEGKDYVDRMQNAAGRMQALINGLLRYAQVTGTRRPFTVVDLGRTAREVLSDLEVAISRAGARIEIDQLPTIEADPMQMHQLFQNLISNALKFQKAGTNPIVKLGCRQTRLKDRTSGETRTEFELSFNDNGTGFDEESADYLFTIFRRLREHSGVEGNGIGLAICRKIVETHGGKISAKSRPGEGATFFVTLPEKQTAGAK